MEENACKVQTDKVDGKRFVQSYKEKTTLADMKSMIDALLEEFPADTEFGYDSMDEGDWVDSDNLCIKEYEDKSTHKPVLCLF